MIDFKKLFGLKMLNHYAPLRGAGIRIKSHNKDITRIEVELRLTWWNKNVVGVQFGGSLYMMCDPFFMAIMMTQLGPDYIVWDKAARIDFLKPGKTTVRALFEISHDEIERVKQVVAQDGKCTPVYHCEIVDEAGLVIAKVEKTLYVRKKSKP